MDGTIGAPKLAERQREDLLKKGRRLAADAKVRYETAANCVLQRQADKSVYGIPSPDGDFALLQALKAETETRAEYLDLLMICSSLATGKIDLTERQTQILHGTENRNQQAGNKLRQVAIAARNRLRSAESRHDYAVEREVPEIRQIGQEYSQALHAYMNAVMEWLSSIDRGGEH